jgi:arylsulfatase A-like enzyme
MPESMPNSPTRPDVYVIVLDTTRAQNLSCYGHSRQTTPALDAFAADAVLYERAISPSPWTVPAHASLFTGLYPSAHRTEGDNPVLGADLPVMADLLRTAGYRTHGISSNIWISDVFKFTRGFERFYKTWQLFQTDREAAEFLKMSSERSSLPRRVVGWLRKGNVPRDFSNLVYSKYGAYRRDDGATKTNRVAARWLDEARGSADPFFLFINYMEPHAPYTPPASFIRKFAPKDASRAELARAATLSKASKQYHLGQLKITEREFQLMEALYDAEIAYLDERVGELLDQIKTAGRWDNSLVIVLGDHGENIGDHELMAHRFSLHNTLVHVPLIVKYPAGTLAAGRVAGYVQLTDVLPTVLDAVSSSDARPAMQGHSLLRQAPADRQVVSEFLSPAFTPEARDPRVNFASSPFNRGLRSIIVDDYKLVLGTDGAAELYNLAADPLELRNLAAVEAGRVIGLRAQLTEWVTRRGTESFSVEEVAVDAVIEDRLRQLGYI